MKKILTGMLVLMLSFQESYAQAVPNPRNYLAYFVTDQLIVDGKLTDSSWEQAPWSEPFLDIQGPDFPKPRQLTRMKMLWDEAFLYIGVRLEENHIWATYTERESVIFHENDIEVFLDPDGDTHHYYELEINALGTVWDLMLTRPYRDGGKPINGWNINDFRHAIHLEGTLNDPTDEDDFWSIEMAIPWKSLSQSGPNFRAPQSGNQWKINFSRVQWQIEADGSGYQKKINPETGKPFPEDNWVWSPMGLVNMHLPDRWGLVQFSDIPVGTGTEPFVPNPDELVKRALRELYEAQRKLYAEQGHYSTHPEGLKRTSELEKVFFEVSDTRFKLSSPSLVNKDQRWYITEDGRIWKE
ncbi:carbohydrate-binding family 9-like protein [Cyclobacterium salsum]|uniref:carbohydrate-binding family 9-like protein n=1 Tax=Cyclobacterium salsum TaxID=2666329 RepID=UPI001390F7D6|nr:carbohydrate-binding family 9-like protein [Cyclobacterium salsum]